MREISEYKIIEARSTDALENTVKTSLQYQWQPLGGVAVQGLSLIQVVVRYKEPYCQSTGPR